MTMQDNQHLFIEALSKRWQNDADQILELAITGKLDLWIAFSNVYLQKVGKGKAGGAKKKKVPVLEFNSLVAVKLLPEVLTQVQGRCDRLMIAAELSCLDGNNKPVTVTNSLGEEWGDSSMIGLNPVDLFAKLDDVLRFERKNKITPHNVPLAVPEQQGASSGKTALFNPKEHPCFAGELHVAVECWQSLFMPAQTIDPATKKAAILQWIRENHPDLSKAAAERIALVVTPSKKGG